MKSSRPAGTALAVLALALAACGCGSSEEAPQVGDNPAAANARSSEEAGDRARARSERMSPGGAPKRTVLGD